jgi:hypothetical protein
MTHTSTVSSTGHVQAGRSPSQDWTRLFYVGAAGVMLILVVIGFRHFFLHGSAHPGRELTPSIRALIIVHGVSMTGWVLAFLVQSLLIATRRRRIHMKLGPIAVVLAAFILVSGLWFNVASFRLAPPDFILWTLTMRQFMVLGFYTLFMFATFFAVGIWYRRQPEIHRPMMLLATVSTMAPAIARIDVVNALYQGTVMEGLFGPSLGMLILGATFFVVKWFVTRTIDRWYAIGYAVLASTQLLTIQFARTRVWDELARVLLR